MRDLIVTAEMQKFQSAAKKTYADRKVIDLDAVQIGWKIETGRVIVLGDATLELTGCPQRLLYDATTNIPSKNVVDHKGQINLQQIAQLILIKNAVVCYSK